MRRPPRHAGWILLAAGLAAVAAAWWHVRARPTVVVLRSSGSTRFEERGCAACPSFDLEGFACAGERADTVIVSGHALPPAYVNATPEEVAAAVSCFRPSLVVLDVCYGASAPILAALAARLPGAWVVAAPTLLPREGYAYGPDLFRAADPERRARAVSTDPASTLLRWRLDAAALREAVASVAGLTEAELTSRLRRVHPPLVRAPLPSELEPGAMVLVPVSAERFPSRLGRAAAREGAP